MNGNIPVLLVTGDTLAQAWEKSLVELHSQGCDVLTEYDKEGDPPSKDCSMTIVIHHPLQEPMIHLDFPGGLEDLQEYVLEVLDGIKDHWVRNADDPNDTRWEYTYHQRLFSYNFPSGESLIDQIEMICTKLAKTPFSRRAQAVTWKVWEDNDCYDPPCLQSIWCRILPDQEGTWILNTNVRFRSNDAYKAAFMNMFALIMLQKQIAEKIADRSGHRVELGRYVHQADSYHLYGSYFREFEGRFIHALHERTFEQRTMPYFMVQDMMEAAIPKILSKVSSMGRR
ncbi:MAG: hypothetical protein EHM72_08640 [Calditrichaeota bacterium]|nr:MAG: hypothetical protein EHM72_08640 [Calditrichota bacterium]